MQIDEVLEANKKALSKKQHTARRIYQRRRLRLRL